MNIEPRYGYLRMLIATLVFDEIVSFSCDIVECQEQLSASKTTTETRKKG